MIGIRYLIQALAQLPCELFISEVGEKLDFNIFWKTHKIPHWLSSVRKKCIFIRSFCKRARQGRINVKLAPPKARLHRRTNATRVTRAYLVERQNPLTKAVHLHLNAKKSFKKRQKSEYFCLSVLFPTLKSQMCLDL